MDVRKTVVEVAMLFPEVDFDMSALHA